jgi:hypothetical protein
MEAAIAASLGTPEASTQEKSDGTDRQNETAKLVSRVLKVPRPDCSKSAAINKDGELHCQE